MMSLHGILAELGLARTPDPLQTALAPDSQWVTGGRFEPEEGACYELAFLRIPPRADEALVIKRVRADGPSAVDWFDLDARRPLARELYAYAVKAWRRLDDAVGDAVDDNKTRMH